MNEKMLITFLPIILMFVAFWFFMVRPEKKKQTKYSAMLAELRVNDKIVTKGGIMAKIVKITEKELIVESEGSRFRIDKNGVNARLK